MSVVTQQVVEVGERGTPQVKVTQSAVEWAEVNSPPIKVTQSVIEIGQEPRPAIRATQLCIEVAIGRRAPAATWSYLGSSPCGAMAGGSGFSVLS